MKLSLAIRFWASTRWIRSTPCGTETGCGTKVPEWITPLAILVLPQLRSLGRARCAAGGSAGVWLTRWSPVCSGSMGRYSDHPGSQKQRAEGTGSWGRLHRLTTKPVWKQALTTMQSKLLEIYKLLQIKVCNNSIFTVTI